MFRTGKLINNNLMVNGSVIQIFGQNACSTFLSLFQSYIAYSEKNKMLVYRECRLGGRGNEIDHNTCFGRYVWTFAKLKPIKKSQHSIT